MIWITPQARLKAVKGSMAMAMATGDGKFDKQADGDDFVLFAGDNKIKVIGS